MQLFKEHLFVLVFLFTNIGLGQPTEKKPLSIQTANLKSQGGTTTSPRGPSSPRPTSPGQVLPAASSPVDENKWRLVHRETCRKFLGIAGFDEHVRLAADESIMMMRTASELFQEVLDMDKEEWDVPPQHLPLIQARIATIYPVSSSASTPVTPMPNRIYPPGNKPSTGNVENPPDGRDRKKDALLVGIRLLARTLFGGYNHEKHGLIECNMAEVSSKRATPNLYVPQPQSARIHCGDTQVTLAPIQRSGQPRYHDTSANIALLVNAKVEYKDVSRCQKKGSATLGYTAVAYPIGLTLDDRSIITDRFNAIYLCDSEIASGHYKTGYEYRAAVNNAQPQKLKDFSILMSENVVPELRSGGMQSILPKLLHYTVAHEFMHMCNYKAEYVGKPLGPVVKDYRVGYGWKNCVKMGRLTDKTPGQQLAESCDNADSYSIFMIGAYMLKYLSDNDERVNQNVVKLRFFDTSGKLQEHDSLNLGKGVDAHFIEQLFETLDPTWNKASSESLLNLGSLNKAQKVPGTKTVPGKAKPSDPSLI